MRSALELIAVERNKQVTEKGFSEEMDKKYTDGQLSKLAVLYATPDSERIYGDMCDFPVNYPNDFDLRYWKPSPCDRIKELVKAGALIVAEIERLQNSK